MVLANIRNNTNMDNGTNATTMPSVMFREIHKNGVLKKYNSEKRTGFPRKSERVWAVFCLHDDTEAFIELYSDQKSALSHKPEWFVSLHNALHISPSIRGPSDEYEFAVTLPNQVVRLAAGTWDSMMEWVETMRNKLRELRVLAPKENVYSKMPEPKHGLLPTRDPTSPLPLPPIGPRGLVPGVESPARTTPAPSTSAVLVSPTDDSSSVQQPQRNGSSANRQHSNGVDEATLLTALSISSPLEVQPNWSSPTNGDNGEDQILSSSNCQTEVRVIPQRSGSSGESNVIAVGSSSGTSVVVVNNDEIASTQLPAEEPPVNRKAKPAAISMLSSSNVTVIEVPPPQSPHYEQLFVPQSVRLPEDSRSKLERVSSSGLIPRVPSRAKREPAEEPRAHQVSAVGDTEGAIMTTSPQVESQNHKSVVGAKSVKCQSSVVRVVPGSSVSVVNVEGPSTSLVTQQNSSHDLVPPMTAAFQSAPSNLDVKDIPLIGGHQRRRRRSSSSDNHNHAVPGPRGLGGADLIRTAPAAIATETTDTSIPTAPLTLRETQVCQLQKEMAHPGGVRLSLRRKHCLNAIALVDILNTVWIAGWKQREHPLLYNALHIGDQLLSVSDTPVRTAADAQKLLKGPVAGMVEIVVRRLPLGKVFTLQRSRREGGVGLLPDATVPGEIIVQPEGVAASAGVPLGATTLDGLAITTWTLTEINGRPLNLFCKAADVNTRLNSVGKELSILVQPSDFIKQLRKQLKNMRSYKDYLLQ